VSSINADNGVVSGITGVRVTADSTGNLVLQSNGVAVLTLATNNTATFAGNVSVTGITTLSNTATATAFIPSGSTVPTYGMYSPSANTIAFSTSGSATTVIDSAGNMQLGYGIAPTTASAPAGMSLCCPANSQLQLYFLKNTQIESHIGFKSGSDGNFYVGTAGGVNGIGTYGLYQANTGTSWIAVSDERFKTNLQPITNALEKISKVRAVTGRYTYDEDTSKSRPFLIAQDFVTALPEAVDQQNPDKLGLSYSDTIPLLVAAIKELNEKILELQAKTN